MNCYKKFTVKPYSVLFIETNLTLENPLILRKDLLEKMSKLITIIGDNIRDKKL